MKDLNILQKDYTLNQSGYQLKLPLNIDCMIPADDSVRLLSQFVEEMDLSDLYSTYQRIPENPSPRTILKAVLYAYMNGDFSSRDMEEAYRRDSIQSEGSFGDLKEDTASEDSDTVEKRM